MLSEEPQSEVLRAQTHLSSFLADHGFDDLGFSQRAAGATGCGWDSPDRTTFQRYWEESLASHWVWVHEFTCEGKWNVVIVSSRGGEEDAEVLRDQLSKEFAPEIASGVMVVKDRWRIALE